MPVKFAPEEIEKLFTGSPEAREALFADARQMRSRSFGNGIFLYGFVYYSTFCNNNCSFCYYRHDNKIKRYRKTNAEIIETAGELVSSGVSLIDLTSGDEGVFASAHADDLLKTISEIRTSFGVPIMISPGIIPKKTIHAAAAAGADFYALYQETHSRRLFQLLRRAQNYDRRYSAKLYAREAGMLIEEGIMTGIGETPYDIAQSFEEMRRLGAEQVRVMSFEPQQGSPMENYPKGDRLKELVIIAMMRLMFPDALIPASLDVDGIAGLKARLNAGANVVTSIIPPHKGYRGVANGELDIDEGGRSVSEVIKALEQLGLCKSDTQELISYIDERKGR